MAKKSGGSVRGGKKATGKSGKKKSGSSVTLEGEVEITQKLKGAEPRVTFKRAVFECPESVHGINKKTYPEEVGEVWYAQRISAQINSGMWATVEFGMTCPCNTTHFGQAANFIRAAVDDTLDEEYEKLSGAEEEEEDGEEQKDWN